MQDAANPFAVDYAQSADAVFSLPQNNDAAESQTAAENEDLVHEILAMNTLAMQRCNAEMLEEASAILTEAYMRLHNHTDVDGDTHKIDTLRSTTMNNLGVVECHRGQHRQALSYFESARQLEETWGTASPSVALNTCAAYNALRMYDKATAAALETIDMLRLLAAREKNAAKAQREASARARAQMEGQPVQSKEPCPLSMLPAQTSAGVNIAKSDNRALWGAAWHNLAVAQINTARTSSETSEHTNAATLFQNAMRSTQELLGRDHPMTRSVTETYRAVRDALRSRGAYQQHRYLRTAPPRPADPRDEEEEQEKFVRSSGASRKRAMERFCRELTITFRGEVTHGATLTERLDATPYPGAQEEIFRSAAGSARSRTPHALRCMTLGGTLWQAGQLYGNPHPLLTSMPANYESVPQLDTSARRQRSSSSLRNTFPSSKPRKIQQQKQKQHYQQERQQYPQQKQQYEQERQQYPQERQNYQQQRQQPQRERQQYQQEQEQYEQRSQQQRQQPRQQQRQQYPQEQRQQYPQEQRQQYPQEQRQQPQRERQQYQQEQEQYEQRSQQQRQQPRQQQRQQYPQEPRQQPRQQQRQQYPQEQRQQYPQEREQYEQQPYPQEQRRRQQGQGRDSYESEAQPSHATRGFLPHLKKSHRPQSGSMSGAPQEQMQQERPRDQRVQKPQRPQQDYPHQSNPRQQPREQQSERSLPQQSPNQQSPGPMYEQVKYILLAEPLPQQVSLPTENTAGYTTKSPVSTPSQSIEQKQPQEAQYQLQTMLQQKVKSSGDSVGRWEQGMLAEVQPYSGSGNRPAGTGSAGWMPNGEVTEEKPHPFFDAMWVATTKNSERPTPESHTTRVVGRPNYFVSSAVDLAKEDKVLSEQVIQMMIDGSLSSVDDPVPNTAEVGY